MSTRRTTVFSMVLIAVVSMAVGMVLTSRLDLSSSSSAQSVSLPPTNSDPITGTIDAQTFRRIATAQTPMVVTIRTESRRLTQDLTDFFGGGDDLFRRFFGQPAPEQERPREEFTQGAGTGFVSDETGLILTNNHVVEDATKIEVGFFNDESAFYEARVVGRDQLTDSALIELVDQPEHDLPVAKFGDSSQIQPGDWVMAIGNPFNLAHTVSVGVISAIGRPFPVAPGRQQDVLQTDAAINPGNSGGPLLNIRGEVPEEDFRIPFGQARVCRAGTEVTIVAIGPLVQRSLEAGDALAYEGISAEIIDPRTLAPLDMDTILTSLSKTGKVLVADESFGPCGVGAEIAAQVMEQGFDDLAAPVRRLNGAHAPTPYSQSLEAAVSLSADQVAAAARDLAAE